MPNQNEPQNMEPTPIDYQVAVDLMISEGEGIWARSNFMLLANSIAIAAVSLALTTDEAPQVLTKGLPIFGLVLCFIWILLVARGFSYQKYFILSARELEARIQNSTKILTRGETFANGEKVTFEISGCNIPHQMNWFARLLTAKINTYLVIVAFILIYLHLLFVV